MKLQSSPHSAEDSVSFLTEGPLSLDKIIGEVTDEKHGGVVTFLGRVRQSEGGRPIRSITYQAYEKMADKQIGEVLIEAQKRWPVKAAACHRIGKVPAGEASVVVASAGVHRKEAFAACQFVIDQIKTTVPIWKVRFE